MKTALNRTRGRAADDGGIFDVDYTSRVELDPEAQPIIKRIGENTCPEGMLDRRRHILEITAVVLRAKRRPFNGYARPTL